MKTFRPCFILTSFFISFAATAAPLSGTESIGPTGDYANIGAAIADVQAQTLGGALALELQATYLSTVETFLTLPALNGARAAAPVSPSHLPQGIENEKHAVVASRNLNLNSFSI